MEKESTSSTTTKYSPSSPQREQVLDHVKELEELFEKIFPLVVEYEKATARVDEAKVIEFLDPKTLSEEFPLSLPDDQTSLDEIVERVKGMLKYSVRTGHPRFMDKLYVGSDAIGQVSEFLTAVLNTNVYIYAVAPLFSLMELEIIRKMAVVVGMDPDNTEGLLVPGGSFANFMGMTAARHHYFPHVRMVGWKDADQPVAFCSAQAHYSVKRASMMLGFGMQGVVSVKADKFGRIDIPSLEEAIVAAKKEGKTPFFVNATAGTTVMGGFDYFKELRTVCTKHNLWMHVDAAWGIAAKFSPSLNHLTDGIESADSLTWDGHKSLGMPIFAAAVVVNNHKGLLQASNSSNAEYLFHDHAEQSHDLGDMSLQCGRRADAVKIWMAWLRYGTNGYRQRVEKFTGLAKYLAAEINKNERFKLVAEPPYGQICFWYIPPSIKDKADKDFASVHDDLNKLTPLIYSKMQRAGNMLVSCNPLSDQKLPYFFRVVVNSPLLTTDDMDFVMFELDRLGKDL